MVQSNSIASTCETAFGIPAWVWGIAVVAIAGYVFIGGVGRLAIVTEKIVPIMAIIYLVWFVAIWFHLTHGFWSAIQTLGWNNKIWLSRWKCISNIYTTVLCLGFAVVAIYFGFIA